MLKSMQHSKIVFLNLLFYASFAWQIWSGRTRFKKLVNRGFLKFVALHDVVETLLDFLTLSQCLFKI